MEQLNLTWSWGQHQNYPMKTTQAKSVSLSDDHELSPLFAHPVHSEYM